MKPYFDFKLAVRQRESSDRYNCKNSIGFLGAYQFGGPRLVDLGLAHSAVGNKIAWRAPWTEQIFLGSPTLQDAAFDIHVLNYKLRIVRTYPSLPKGFDMSGAIGVCHLLGMGGLADLIRGTDTLDGFGTKASEYCALFSGYLIP